MKFLLLSKWLNGVSEMTKEIHKYKVDTIDEVGLMAFCRVDMPKGAKVINA